METEIFELKANDAGDDGWVQVTKEEWIRAERASGFRPRMMSSTDPLFMTTCATASFHSSLGSSGRRRTTG